MTECPSDPVPASTAGRRQLLADFSAGAITSDAGLLLPREADRRIGTAAVGVETCLLLHTPEHEELAAQIGDRLGRLGPPVRPVLGPISDDGGWDAAVSERVRPFVAGVDPTRVAADATPGTKLMSRAVERATPAGG